MWKIWHRIFGWDYVCIENSAESYVRRVWWRGDGAPMVSAYENQHWRLAPPYHGWKVTALTKGAVVTMMAQEAHHRRITPSDEDRR